MRGRNVFINILVMVLTASTIANGHWIPVHPLCRALHKSLRSTQSAWKGPCKLHRHMLECSLLFGKHMMPNPYLRNNFGSLTPKLQQILRFNMFAHPELCGMNVLPPITDPKLCLLNNCYKLPFTSNGAAPNDYFLPKFTSKILSNLQKTTNPLNSDINSVKRYSGQFDILPINMQSIENGIGVPTEQLSVPTVDEVQEHTEESTFISFSEAVDEERNEENTFRNLSVSVDHENNGESTVRDPTVTKDQKKYEDSTLGIPAMTTDQGRNVEYALSNLTNHSSISKGPGHIELSTSKSTSPDLLRQNKTLFEIFRKTLERLERKFLLTTFTKLTAISPENRRENGISFLQSGLFLHLLLVSLSTGMDGSAAREIERCLGLEASKEEKVEMVRQVVSWLPASGNDLRFRRSSRLVLARAARAGDRFRRDAATMNLTLSWINGTETPAEIAKTLNQMVEVDSGGAIHDTFEEEEVEGACGIALATLYLRGRWRTAPTLLNGSRGFRDAAGAPPRAVTLFRLNDLMGYAYLHEWDAEAIEISYAMPGLSLLILVPKEPSLRGLVERVAAAGLGGALAALHQVRLAVTLPLYTLRMTLLLPNKLEKMGMPSLLTANATDCQALKLSHAVQRLMFWAEAGPNAYKDDGIEWDPRPEMELVLDRPYLFFVRWHNITLMNGNFVL